MPHSSGGGSHSGGSSHSSSHSSGGGSHSGGGSSYSAPRIYSSYHAGTHRYVYYTHGRPKYYYSAERPESTIGLRIFLLIFLAIWIAVSIPFWMAAINHPKKLTTDYDTSIMIQDDLNVIEDSEEEKLYTAFKEFQDETGITPALITSDNAAWQEYYTDITNYAYDLYVNNFEDEKHWLFVYTSDQSEFDNWHWEGMQGDNTDGILTNSKTEAFNKDVQKYLTARSRYGVGESFATALSDMEPMKTTIFWPMMIFMIIFDGFPCIILVPTLVQSFMTNEKMTTATRCKTDTDPVREDTCEYCGGVYVHGLHLSCPHCGAPIKAQSGVDPQMLKQ